MRLYLRRIALVIVLLGASPASAAAQFIDFIDWLDRLSGPSFRGITDDIVLACKPQEGPVRGFDCPPLDALNGALQAGDRKLVFGLRVGGYGSGAAGGYRLRNDLVYPVGVPLSEKKINLLVLGPFVTWQIHRSIDLTGAVEFNRFAGPLVDPFWVASVQPSIAWKPLVHFPGIMNSRLARTFRIIVGFKQYLQTLKAADFGASSGFEPGKEGVLRVAGGIDLMAAFVR